MRGKIRAYIRKWERQGYSNGIPDEADPRLEALGKAPSYRLICRAILRNDIALTTLGYSKNKCMEYMELKRIEIAERAKK